jgi:hypothetical protein
MDMENATVLPISYQDTKPWLLEKHYARRMPSISFAYGLFIDDKLEGVVTYGHPPSPSLCKGVCGEQYKGDVLELNRLVVNSTAPKNSSSFLVGRSLKMLPRDSIIVSFADTAQGHVGYVYQATNWTYTGLSAKRTDWKLKGYEHLHGVTVADMSRGQANRAEWMRETYGEAFYLEDRPRKHRYVFFRNKKARRCLKYPTPPYPKGESKRYDCKDI